MDYRVELRLLGDCREWSDCFGLFSGICNLVCSTPVSAENSPSPAPRGLCCICNVDIFYLSNPVICSVVWTKDRKGMGKEKRHSEVDLFMNGVPFSSF